MPHKFDIKKKNKLDNPKRREILPPKETLQKLMLTNGDIMADIGCGIGYFTIPASEIVGKDGKVLGLDISIEMIDEVKKRIRESNINNVSVFQTDENNLKLEDNSVTYAFMCNVLHEISDKEKLLLNIKKQLKKKGK